MLSIKTERLILRDFLPDDFEAFYAALNDLESQAYYPERETTRGFYVDLFGRILSWAVASRTRYQLAICLQTGELIGTCGVRIEATDDQQASFGCAINRVYSSNGYAYEASKSILNFGFSSLPIHRIYAETISENVKARKLAERLGMRLEGELIDHKLFRGRWWNTAIYAIRKNEWSPKTLSLLRFSSARRGHKRLQFNLGFSQFVTLCVRV